jgi:hypothetical protein
MINIKNTKLGLTGWLSPEGEFRESEYGHHHELANSLLEQDVIEDKDKFIGMGSKGINHEELSYIYSPFELTEQQEEWFQKNENLLDETQKYLFQLEHII